MSTLFERFAKMAEEEFGYTVVKINEKDTFEALYGVDVQNDAQYELPYEVSFSQVGYYSISNGDSLPYDSDLTDKFSNNFSTDADIFKLAA